MKPIYWLAIKRTVSSAEMEACKLVYLKEPKAVITIVLQQARIRAA